MTVPSGHPDWQNIDVKAGAPVYYNASFSAPVLTQTPVLTVGNYDQIWLRADPNGTSSYLVQVQWFDLNPGGILLLSERFFIRAPNQKMSQCLPTIAPFVQITVTPVVFNAGDTIRLSVSPVTDHQTMADLNGPLVGEIRGLSVGAGASVTQDCTFIAPGSAEWYFGWDGSTGSASILAMDNTGVFHTEFTFPAVAGPHFETHTIPLPAVPCQLQVSNSGGVPANFWSILGTDL